ncbi:senescence-specific cysteine protease SAG39-like [Henckelia pumila]|uniref:senescence-specific cysteine protease SAG39-like n=1 Tax=Henckelia pumila TaxID=405737 RepID=UPI003C6E3CDD
MVSIQTSCLIIFMSLFKEPSHQATFLTPEDHEMSIKHKNWMIQNKSNYLSEEETERRFKIFKDNVEYIENFNRDKSHTYELGINEFADLTKEEFHSMYTRNSMPSYRRFSVSTNFRYENVRRVPCSLDWRELGAVTPVKNQGNCGISWIRSCVLESLSEQHIIDCDGASNGCKLKVAVSSMHAFEFVKRNKGLSSDKDYPYQKKEGTCKSDKPSSLAAKITGYERVPANNETAMLMAVAN